MASFNTTISPTPFGFFDSDSEELINYANQYGLIFDSKIEKETWAALILVKN